MTWPVAVEWRVGDVHETGEIRIVSRGAKDGIERYAVTLRGWTANKEGEWEHEPLPSSRDEKYFARCRWEDWGEAAQMAEQMYAKEKANPERLR